MMCTDRYSLSFIHPFTTYTCTFLFLSNQLQNISPSPPLPRPYLYGQPLFVGIYLNRWNTIRRLKIYFKFGKNFPTPKTRRGRKIANRYADIDRYCIMQRIETRSTRQLLLIFLKEKKKCDEMNLSSRYCVFHCVNILQLKK